VVTPIKPLPGAENAGKPGYYTVKPGDTLIRIGLENGQGWKDIARWNNLDNANLIEVGQVLRVVPPAAQCCGGRCCRNGRGDAACRLLRQLFLPRLPARPSRPPVLPVSAPAPIRLPTSRCGSFASRSEDDEVLSSGLLPALCWQGLMRPEQGLRHFRQSR
jgi:lipoprotein NlpD